MENFIKALSLSVLLSGSFMTQAMDDFDISPEEEARILNQLAQRKARGTIVLKPKPQVQPKPHVFNDKGMEASLRLAQELQAQEDRMNFLASTKQDHQEKARQLQQDRELALRMSQPVEKPMPYAPMDPDLEATARLIRQLTTQEPEQVLSDALLARALQDDRQGGDPYYNGKGRDPYLGASLKLAYQLQDERDPLGAYKLPYLKKKVTPEDLIAYEIIVTAAKTIQIDSDVHAMTHRFARPHYGESKRLEQTYLGILSQPNKLLTLEEIQADLEGLANRNQAIAQIMAPILELFTNPGYLPTYWNAPVDGETGLDIREVMSNCFTLARFYGDGALANLAIILADNRQTGGGCHPGVTGRLAHTFFTEVSAAIALG